MEVNFHTIIEDNLLHVFTITQEDIPIKLIELCL